MSTQIATTAHRPELDIDTPITVPAEATESNFLALAEQAETLREAAAGWRDYALQLRRKNTAVLGRDEAFLVRDGAQQVRCVKANVRLTVEDGHMYRVQGNWNVTANGYTRINQVAGVTIVQPEEIVVAGETHENPYLEMHPERPGVLLRVHTRVLTVGRSATGQPVAIDYRLKWDPNLYLAQALKGITVWIDDPSGAKKNGRPRRVKTSPADAVRDMLESEYRDERAAGALKGWGFLPLSSVGDDFLGIAFNVRHPTVAEKVGDQVNLVAFAERRAQTIARRNALRHHPSIAVTRVNPRDVKENSDGRPVSGWVDVPVYAWPPDDRSVREVADMVVNGTQGTAPNVTSAQVVDEAADPLDDIEEGVVVDGGASE